MRKALFVVLLFLIVAAFYLTWNYSPPLNADNACPFCNEAILNDQQFYEDERVIALYTHKPVFPGHCLIIPKRHVVRFEELTELEVREIGQTIKKVHEAVSQVFGTSPYLLLQKNGREAGQTVAHVHFHYIPRKTGDGSTLKFLFKLFLVNASKPIEVPEMEKAVSQLKQAVKEQKKASLPKEGMLEL